MAITFVNAGTEGAGTTQTVSPGLPASIAANDILICLAHCSDIDAGALTMSGDWTAVTGTPFGGTGEMGVWWHRYDGTNNPSTTVDAGVNPTGTIVAGICAFRGCKSSGSPFNQVGTAQTGTDSSIEHSGITPTVDNCMLVALNGSHDDNTRTLVTNWTNIFEDTTAGTQNAFIDISGTPDGSCSAFYLLQTTAAATGTITVTQSGADGWGSILVALEPDNAKVLSAESGSYSITGTTASLEFGRKLSAESGSYSVSGSAATLRLGKRLSVEAGSYSISGTDASFVRTYILAANAGSYSISGTDASLELGRKLSAESGSYSVSGTDAALEFGRKLQAEASSYSISGTDVSFVRSYRLNAESGSYSISGQDVSLEFGRKLVAESGSYSVSGQDANLFYGRKLIADVGSYLLVGSDATLVKAGATSLSAESGSYAVSGSDSSLLFGRLLTCVSGAYSITGYDADLLIAVPSPHKGKRRIRSRVVRISGYRTVTKVV